MQVTPDYVHQKFTLILCKLVHRIAHEHAAPSQGALVLASQMPRQMSLRLPGQPPPIISG